MMHMHVHMHTSLIQYPAVICIAVFCYITFTSTMCGNVALQVTYKHKSSLAFPPLTQPLTHL
jgi:hypothetical protein